MLLRTVLPMGLMGLMLSAYFSAIMSTADSCLMAASGNVVTDIISKFTPLEGSKQILRISQITTFLIGAFALLIALQMQNVLELMLLSYAFMVSGLFIPVIGGLYWRRTTATAAFWAMLLGGGVTLTFILSDMGLMPFSAVLPYGLDANIAGISVSLLTLIVLSLLTKRKTVVELEAESGEKAYQYDRIR